MSKVRIPINPKQVGRVGAYSMYVRAGEQIVRQRQNASNYGETASRTYTQQLRRVMWSNLVNQFRAIAFWQPRAYENIRAGQTDYNKFMSLNVNAASLPLTKQMASDGATIVTPVVVSQGSLPSPQTILENDVLYLGLIITAEAGEAMATVGDFSAAVLASNPGYAEGDALCFVGLRNWQDLSDVPRASCDYAEVVLDRSDSTPLDSIAGGLLLAWSNDQQLMSFVFRPNVDQPIMAATCIHTRRNVSSLAVSTEKLVMLDTSIIELFSGDEWLQECIDSYGTSTLVPLEPDRDGKTYSADFAKRIAVMSEHEVEFAVDGDGKLYRDRETGSVLTFDPTDGVWAMVLASQLPPSVNAWDFTITQVSRNAGKFSIVANGGLFTFAERTTGMTFPVYPRVITYTTKTPA